MAKKNDIFRKKSLERISSPEQLNDYIKVSNPSVWIIIIAIFCVLGGGFYWGVAGRIPTTVAVNGASYVEENAKEAEFVKCYLSEKDAAKVTKAINEGTIASVSVIPSDNDEYGSINCVLPTKEDIAAEKVSSAKIKKEFEGYLGSSLASVDGYYTELKLRLEKKDGRLAWSNDKNHVAMLQGNTSCKVSIVTKEDQPIQFLTK